MSSKRILLVMSLVIGIPGWALLMFQVDWKVVLALVLILWSNNISLKSDKAE